jgi:glycosyltransferase involved in cell wall biosynthesis
MAGMSAATLSIIVPVLDEAAGIDALMRSLAPLRGPGVEVIVVDGGSRDDTVARCGGGRVDRIVTTTAGRAHQMNAGAAAARGELLLFLHADTVLPANAPALVREALGDASGDASSDASSDTSGDASGDRSGDASGEAPASGAAAATRARANRHWGRFDVRIVGGSAWLPLVATMMNWRSRATGIATGDQAMFMRREAFDAVGGFPEQPLMEDIEISRRLKRLERLGPPVCLRERVSTSGRRWDRRGAWRTIVLMWRLRLLYWFGVSPERLARQYR